MTHSAHATIDASMKLRDVVAQWPETLEVLTEYGMDACCGGELTIEHAAKAHGVELEVLLGRLLKAEG